MLGFLSVCILVSLISALGFVKWMEFLGEEDWKIEWRERNNDGRVYEDEYERWRIHSWNENRKRELKELKEKCRK